MYSYNAESSTNKTAAQAMGASGVVIGTKFLVAEEIWAHEDYKKRLIEATELDTALCMQSIRNTVRVLRNETSDAVQKLESEMDEVTIQDLLPLVSGKIGREAYVTGDCRNGMLAAGHAMAFIKKIEPIAQIVATLEDEETRLSSACMRLRILGQRQINCWMRHKCSRKPIVVDGYGL